MIMNNDNKKLPKNRKQRIERRINLDDKITFLLNKIKSGKKKKNNDKSKEIEIE